MRIEVEQRGTKQFYDELLSVMNQYKKILADPKTRIRGFTTRLTMYLIYVVLALIMILSFYGIFHDKIFLIMSGMLGLLFAYAVFMMVRAKARISGYMYSEGTKVFELDQDGISYSDDEKVFKVNWSSVAAVVINRNATAFVPKENTGIVIAIQNLYADQIIEGLKQYGKENLLSDNRHMYN
ncbi:MAG: hypothetical protein IJM15_00785 [Erysipelotrichaceae bacterium]|nr:hypothetical protein [Erysipelotrichaceae bacterium]